MVRISSITMVRWGSWIFLRGKFIPKITIFGDFSGRISPHFKATMLKVGVTVGNWDSLPHAKFCKNR